MPTIVTQINERNMAITTPCPAELVEAQSLQELVDKFGEEIVFGWAAAQAVIAFRSTVRTKASAKDKESGEYLYDAETIANGDCLAGNKEYQSWENWMPSVRKAKELLGWEPKIAMQQSVNETMDFFIREAAGQIEE